MRQKKIGQEERRTQENLHVTTQPIQNPNICLASLLRRFFEAYSAPEKLVLQVYVALLRASQAEGRALARQALDILTPALPHRLPHNPAEHKYPIWIRYTKKILVEEGHTLPILVHIWQLIARHSDLFYAARLQFVPQMVSKLNTLGSVQTAPAENRRLGLDLGKLVIDWEIKRRSLAAQSTSRQGSIDQSSELPGAKRTRPLEMSEGPIKLRKTEAGLTAGNLAHGSSGTGGVGSSQIGATARARIPGAQPTTTGSSGAATASSVRPNAGGAVRAPANTGNTRPASGTINSARGFGSASGEQNQNVSSTSADDEFQPTDAMVETLVTFFARVAFVKMEQRERALIAKRSKVLIEKAVTLWPKTPVKLQHLEKILDIGNDALQRSSVAGPTNSSAGAAQQQAELASSMKQSQALARVGGTNSSQGQASSTAASVALAQSTLNSQAQGKVASEQKSDQQTKIEALAAERAVALNTALTTALDICQILVDKQGAVFIELNKGPLCAIAKVSMVCNDVKLVDLFASLLAKMLRILPPTTSTGAISNVVTQAICDEVQAALGNCLKSNDKLLVYTGLKLLEALDKVNPKLVKTYQGDLVARFDGLARAIVASTPRAAVNDAATSNLDKEKLDDKKKDTMTDTASLVLCLSFLSQRLLHLGDLRKKVFQALWYLFDRCSADVLLQIVEIVAKWVEFRPSPKEGEPLAAKEKIQFLLKMAMFERLSGPSAKSLQAQYVQIIYRIFEKEGEEGKRPELLQKLEKVFMIGLRTQDPELRKKFFKILDASVKHDVGERMKFIIMRQNWEYLADTFWICQALELLLVELDGNASINSNKPTGRFPAPFETRGTDLAGTEGEANSAVVEFARTLTQEKLRDVLRQLLQQDTTIAHQLWVQAFPAAWKEVDVSVIFSDQSCLVQTMTFLTKDFLMS